MMPPEDPQEPWGDWPSKADRILCHVLVVIVCIWSLAVTAGCVGYIYQTLAG